MNKTELIEVIATKAEVSKADASKMVAAYTEAVTDALKAGDTVQLVGFGTFSTKDKPAKTCRNPKTGEAVKVPAKTVAKFKPGAALADAVNVPKKKASKKK